MTHSHDAFVEQPLLEPIAARTRTLLGEEMGIEVLASDPHATPLERLALQDYTVMIGVGGGVSLFYVTSYDSGVVDRMVEVLMDGEPVADDERAEVYESVSSEIANTIIGNALPFFPDGGRGTTITPPVSIHDIHQIAVPRKSKVAAQEIRTALGAVMVYLISE